MGCVAKAGLWGARIQLVVPSNPDIEYLTRDHRQGRGGWGVAKAYWELEMLGNSGRRDCCQEAGEGGS